MMEAHSFPEGYLTAGIGPGILYSFGSTLRFTLSFDLAWPLIESTPANLVGHAIQAVPSVGLEVPLERDLTLAIEARVWFAFADEQTLRVPMLSAVVVW
jgi:hypothetical protein